MAELDREALCARVADGRIVAISLDTNVFARSGYRLDAGLLKHLRQFAEANIAFVLADVVERELKRHLLREAEEAARNFEQAMVKMERHGLIATEAAGAARAGCRSPHTVVEERLAAFRQATAMGVIASHEHVDVAVLLDAYFETSAPFEHKADKKHEFPDAIALMALEQWATRRDAEMLVVSKDKGWRAYARGSDRLHVVEGLADAYAAFSEPVKNARVMAAIERSLAGDDRDTIHDALSDQVQNLSFLLECDSYFSVELEQQSVALAEMTFAEIERDELLPIASGKDADGDEFLSLQVTLPIALDIEAYASFAVYDSIDKDYVPLAGDDVSMQHELDVEVLLTYSVRTVDDAVQVTLREVELLTRGGSVHFGELEPDFGPPDEY